MFNVERVAPDRLDITLSGRLEADSMKIALDDLLRQADGIENGKMLYEVIDFHIPSLGALTIELSRLPELFGLVKRFRRAALLADETWMQKTAELKGFLIPGLEIQPFERSQRDQAEAWLNADE